VTDKPRRLLIGEGAGIGPTIFLAEQMQGTRAVPDASTADAGPFAVSPGVATVARYLPLVLLGSNTPFPFRPRPSVIVVPGIPIGIIACMPLLEEWGIASRLASTADLPGCFEGLVTDLADAWLSSLTPTNLAEVEILSCGPTPLLEATATLARRHNVPYQTSSPDVPTARD
jgi:dihydroorotate dehydrogenase electron transfer subunit